MSSAGGSSSASVARMSSTLVSAASFTGALVSDRRSARMPDLGDRLLAGNIDDRPAGIGERAGDLKQQRRLADAGIAADEQRRAAHEAAAGDPVELGDARLHARGLVAAAGKQGERHRAALAELAGRRAGGNAAAGAFRDQRVPLAAGVALALPAGGNVAATLADEGDFRAGGEGSGHAESLRINVRHMFS